MNETTSIHTPGTREDLAIQLDHLKAAYDELADAYETDIQTTARLVREEYVAEYADSNRETWATVRGFCMGVLAAGIVALWMQGIR